MQINNGEILGLTTQKKYQLGQLFYDKDLVVLSDIGDDFFSAKVHADTSFEIAVHRNNNNFVTSCSCSSSSICEHVIAALLYARDYYSRHKNGVTSNPSDTEVSNDPVKEERGWRDFITALHHSNAASQVKNGTSSRKQEWDIYFTLSPKPGDWVLTPYRAKLRKDGTWGMAYPTTKHERPYYPINSTQKENLALMMLDSADTSSDKKPEYPFSYDRIPAKHGYQLSYGIDIGMVFDLLNQSLIFFEEDTQRSNPLKIQASSVQFKVELREEDDFISLEPYFIKNDEKIRYEHTIKILTVKPAWVLIGAELLKLEGSPPAEFLLSLRSQDAQVHVPKDEFSEFFAAIEKFPDLLSHLVLPNRDTISVVDTFTQKTLHLKENRDILVITLTFQYGDKEFPCQPHNNPSIALPKEELVIQNQDGLAFLCVRRDHQSEDEACKMVIASGVKRITSGEFTLREGRSIDWMLFELPKLIDNGFNVIGEEKLKRCKVNRATPQVKMAIRGEIDWFDCQMTVDYDGIVLSLKELKKSLMHRTSYVTLNDGSVALLPDELQKQFSFLVNLGKLTQNKVKVSRHHVTLIDHLFDEVELEDADDDYSQSLNRLKNFKSIKSVPISKHFKGNLRPYQKRGLDWLYFLQEFGFGGCLADDMGLGKTIQTLAMLQKEKDQGISEPSLIVCPTSVIFNWQNEIKHFTPGLSILAHVGMDRRRTRNFDGNDIVLCSYGILRRDIDFLKDVKFHYVILDESQHIKTPTTQTAKAVRLLKTSHRLVLTGTPVENSTQELWSQFNFLNPGLLGNLRYFKNSFARPIERDRDEKVAALLRNMISPFILRRSKSKVAKDLPPKTESLFLCDMSIKQRKLYGHWRDYYRAQVMQRINSDGLDKSRIYVLEGLTCLRQLCCHPNLIEKDSAAESGKFEALQELLQGIISEGHKILVFSQFVRMLHIIRNYLDQEKVTYAYLDGSTRDRLAPVEQFQNDPETKVFLISLKAGGFGLNLTAADYVILYDPWWNPAAEAQAIDRTHRIGQKKSVFAYRMIARDSIEEKILQLQEKKRELVADLITTDSGTFKKLNAEDIEKLFS